MDITRRNFIKGGIGLLGGLCMSQSQLLALAAQAATSAPRASGKKVLVIVQLGGGNDGLNTVVPFGIGSYYQLRPTLAVAQDQVLPVTNVIGFNPNLSGFSDLYKNGKLALLQGVGYPNPNRSHFRSMEIWQTADPTKIADEGWLGKYLDYACPASAAGSSLSFPAINVNPSLPKSLLSSKVVVPSVDSIYDFRFKTDPRYVEDRKTQIQAFNDIYGSFPSNRPYVDLLRKVGLDAREASDYLLKVVRNYKGTVDYPNNGFANSLKFIAQMITGGVNSSIYNVNLDGFDTHANQVRTQNNLLKQLGSGLAAFQADLEGHNVDKDVLVMVFTEFGRRVAENGGHGTDHGTAEPMFIIGSGVKGGVYGDNPDLTRLDEGDLRYKIDFRCVYATILDRWMQADSRQVLGAHFDQIEFLA